MLAAAGRPAGGVQNKHSKIPPPTWCKSGRAATPRSQLSFFLQTHHLHSLTCVCPMHNPPGRPADRRSPPKNGGQALPQDLRKSNGRSSIANMALFPVCCSRHWQGVEAMQLGAKQPQLTASTGTSGFPSIIDSRRPVLHSQHIPTFCNAERQHSSSTSMRELSYFTRGQHYDDCGYTA